MDLEFDCEENEKIGKGYMGFSKSINALEAEEKGLFPASTIAKLTKTSADFIRDTFVPREWHHTSKHYNKTFYYSLEEVEGFLRSNPHAYKAWKEERKSKKVTRIASRVIFYDWTFGYPEEIELNDIMVEFNGKQSYSFDYKGKKITKRSGTNGFYICWKPTEEELRKQKEEEAEQERKLLLHETESYEKGIANGKYVDLPECLIDKIENWQSGRKFWVAMKGEQAVDAICMHYRGDDFAAYRESSRSYLAQKGEVISAMLCHFKSINKYVFIK
jgi:hypothetical protein